MAKIVPEIIPYVFLAFLCTISSQQNPIKVPFSANKRLLKQRKTIKT
jgi:hypothetical protein